MAVAAAGEVGWWYARVRADLDNRLFERVGHLVFGLLGADGAINCGGIAGLKRKRRLALVRLQPPRILVLVFAF